MTLQFTIHHKDGQARTGTLSTKHGDIRTPAFMPVGTAATVKAMHPEAVAATGADILLGNTYHLMLRPTAERVARLGGLHKFMKWSGPILTDSGGFQVMSLSHLRKMTEKAVTFQSHIDGSSHELSPERSMEIQHLLGSTITMALDECTPFPATEDVARSSMELSMRWAARSRAAYDALKKDTGGAAGAPLPAGEAGLLSVPQARFSNPGEGDYELGAHRPHPDLQPISPRGDWTNPTSPAGRGAPAAPIAPILKSPGQLASHYAPSIPVRLNASHVAPDEALLAFGPAPLMGAVSTLNLSARGDLIEAAANLFAHLRALDVPHHRAIAVMPIPNKGVGEAINDRLTRAAV